MAINTETEVDLAGMSRVQLAWLEATLRTAPRPRWTIVFGHRPFWCTNHGGNDVPHGNAVLQRLAEDMLLEAGVDLVIQGHEHDYERTLPLRKGQPTATNYTNPTAPVYVVNGGAGNREGNESPSDDQPWVPHPSPGSSLISFGVFTLSPDALAWQEYASANASVFDAFTITKA